MPAEARHAVGLLDGDRVLVVARPDLDAVIVYPMPADSAQGLERGLRTNHRRAPEPLRPGATR